MAFHVGMKVVCIDASGYEYFLSRGTVYQIGSIKDCWLRLVEVDPNGGFHRRRFRPVIERKTETGIAILKELLNPANHKVLEGA